MKRVTFDEIDAVECRIKSTFLIWWYFTWEEIVKEIIEDAFEPKYATVIFGGIIENQTLIHTPIDYIFFTRSKKVGSIVYEATSKMMIASSIELGGKRLCIVDKVLKLSLRLKELSLVSY